MVNLSDLYTVAKFQITPEFILGRKAGVENCVKSFDLNFAIGVVKFLRGEEISTFEDKIKAKVREKDITLGENNVRNELRVIVIASCDLIFLKKWEMDEATILAFLILTGLKSRKKEMFIVDLISTAEKFLEVKSKKIRSDFDVNLDVWETIGEDIGKEIDIINIGERFKAISTGYRNITLELKSLRDETNILWWILGDRSFISNVSFSKLNPEFCGFVIGNEMADLISALPGPSSYRNLLNKVILCKNPGSKSKTKSAFLSTLKSCGEIIRQETIKKFQNAVGKNLNEYRTLFPIHYSFVLEKEMGLEAFIQFLKKNGDLVFLESLNQLEVGEQTYLENLGLKTLISLELKNA